MLLALRLAQGGLRALTASPGLRVSIFLHVCHSVDVVSAMVGGCRCCMLWFRRCLLPCHSCLLVTGFMDMTPRMTLKEDQVHACRRLCALNAVLTAGRCAHGCL